MDSTWIAFAPFLVFFGWLMGQQRHGSNCPHCGGKLVSGFGAIGRKPKTPDDELAGGKTRFGVPNSVVWTTTCALSFIVALPFIIYAVRSTPVIAPPARAPVMLAPPAPAPLRAATTSSLPTPAPQPAGG